MSYVRISQCIRILHLFYFYIWQTQMLIPVAVIILASMIMDFLHFNLSTNLTRLNSVLFASMCRYEYDLLNEKTPTCSKTQHPSLNQSRRYLMVVYSTIFAEWRLVQGTEIWKQLEQTVCSTFGRKNAC